MPAISISVPQMVDLALATPEVGGMNLGALHALMQIIVKKLELSECKVEFRGTKSDVFESLVARMPKKTLFQIDEFVPDQTDETKRTPVEKSLQVAKNIFTVNQLDGANAVEGSVPPGFPLQPIQVFAEEDFRDIASQPVSVHDMTAPILPKTEDLLHEKGGDDNAIVEMYKLLNLEKRLEAVEAALKRLNVILRKFGEKTSMQFEGTSLDHNQPILAELMERIGVIEESLTRIDNRRQSVVSGKSGISSKSGASARGGSVSVAGASDKADMQSIASDTLSSAMTRGGSSAFSEQIVEKVVDLLCSENIPIEKCGLARKLRDSIFSDLKTEVLENINHIMDVGGAGHKGRQQESAEYKNKWFKDCANFSEGGRFGASNQLSEDEVFIQSLLANEFFLSSLEKALAVQCACPPDIVRERELEIVSDRLSLVEEVHYEFHTGKKEGSLVYFKELLERNRKIMEDVSAEVVKFYEEFIQTSLETQQMLDCKLDKCDIPPLKQFFSQQLETLTGRINELANKKTRPEVTAGIYNLLPDLKCIACNTEACMKDRVYPGTVPKYPKIPESKVLKAKDQEICYTPRRRFCGGRHTVTTPEDRLPREGHFLDQFNVHAPAADVTLAEGLNGRMFRVDAKNVECVCLKPAPETTNRCKKPVTEFAVLKTDSDR